MVGGWVGLGVGGGIGERQHHLGERDAVGDAVVHPGDHGRAVSEPVDEVDLPQRAVVIKRRRDQFADQFLQRARVAGRRERQMVHVMLEIEVGVVLPAGWAQRHAALDHALAKPGIASDEAAAVDLFDAGHVDRLVEEQDGVDHHQVGGAVHVQPGRIGVGQARAHDRGPLVEAGEQLGVQLVDGRSLDLHRRCDLASGLAEVMVEDREALDLLDAGELGVDGVDLVLDLLADPRIVRDGLRVGGDAEPVGQLGRFVAVEGEHGDQVGPVVSEDDRLGDVARLAQLTFDVDRRDVLAVGGDDEVLLAPGDRHESVVVDGSEISSAQPAVSGEGLLGGLGVVVVATEHLWPADEDLAVGGDGDLGSRQWPADGAEAQGVWRVERGDRAALAQPVAFEHEHAAGVKELEQLGRDAGGSDHGELQLVAEDAADLGEDEPVGQPVLERLERAERLSVAQRGRGRACLVQAPSRRSRVAARARPGSVPARRRGSSRRRGARPGSAWVGARRARR